MSPAAFAGPGSQNGHSNHTSNGTATKRGLAKGIYVPTVAFFDPETEELDTKSISRHVTRLVNAGVTGLAVQGSNGEAVLLTPEERSVITRTTRAAMDTAGFENMPLIVGCGAQSTFETLKLCKAAAADGGDYALVLPPSYYSSIFSPTTIIDFFTRVADASPIPVIIYNYPGATPGIDLNSDTLISLSKHSNIAGCKFTCGNTGKLGRVVASVRARRANFRCFAGSVDFTISALANGADGVVGGLANIAPRASVRLYELAQSGKSAEATDLQEVVANADWTAIQTGVLGVKAALREFYGYGGWARHPLPRPNKAEVAKIADGMQQLVDIEKSLES